MPENWPLMVGLFLSIAVSAFLPDKPPKAPRMPEDPERLEAERLERERIRKYHVYSE